MSMQNWRPNIAAVPGPKYLAIAEALARDVRSGALRAGTRLPPQRALADTLGIDLTTVTRAYNEARRRGLIEGEGRRGSFVRPLQADVARNVEPNTADKEAADVDMVGPPETPGGLFAIEYRRSVDTLLARGELPFHYQPSGRMVLAREAGADLLAGRGIPRQDDTIVIAAGSQHALHAVLSTELKPGDRLAVGGFVYPGLLALAHRHGLKLVVIASDHQGLDPAALDAACAQGRVRGVYVIPTNDNPTTATMGLERRHALAEVARRHGLIVIEDDAYGLLPEAPLPPVAAFAPELTWHIASVSKVLAPGLRVAWLKAPDVAKAWRLAADMYETAVMAPPLNAAVVADWLGTGVFQRLIDAVRFEAQHRQRIARGCLAEGSFLVQPEGYHLWMPLPAEASANDIANALRPQGLPIVAGEAFAVDRTGAAPALRVSIGNAISRERLGRCLRLLGALTGPGATRKVSLV